MRMLSAGFTATIVLMMGSSDTFAQVSFYEMKAERMRQFADESARSADRSQNMGLPGTSFLEQQNARMLRELEGDYRRLADEGRTRDLGGYIPPAIRVAPTSQSPGVITGLPPFVPHGNSIAPLSPPVSPTYNGYNGYNGYFNIPQHPFVPSQPSNFVPVYGYRESAIYYPGSPPPVQIFNPSNFVPVHRR